MSHYHTWNTKIRLEKCVNVVAIHSFEKQLFAIECSIVKVLMSCIWTLTLFLQIHITFFIRQLIAERHYFQNSLLSIQKVWLRRTAFYAFLYPRYSLHWVRKRNCFFAHGKMTLRRNTTKRLQRLKVRKSLQTKRLDNIPSQTSFQKIGIGYCF